MCRTSFLGLISSGRAAAGRFNDERVTSHQWRAEFERRLNEDLTAALIGRYGLRLYNEAFAERDTHFYSVGPRLNYRATSWITFRLGYLYERGLADGRQEPQFMDDVSYYLHFLSFGMEVRLTSNLALNLTYLHVRKTFTSNLVGDTHLDRQDFTHQGLAALRYQFTTRVAATLSFQHTQRTSTNVLRDFNDTIVSLEADYRF